MSAITHWLELVVSAVFYLVLCPFLACYVFGPVLIEVSFSQLKI